MHYGICANCLLMISDKTIRNALVTRSVQFQVSSDVNLILWLLCVRARLELTFAHMHICSAELGLLRERLVK